MSEVPLFPPGGPAIASHSGPWPLSKNTETVYYLTMSRPKNDPGERFGPSELALAGELTLRQFQHLDETGLLPETRDVRGLKRMVLVGGLMRAGLTLVVSGRLAALVASEAGGRDGEVSTGLQHLVGRVPPRYVALAQGASDYWYHRAVYAAWRGGEDGDVRYQPGRARGGDLCIEIIDRALVMTSYLAQPGGSEPASISRRDSVSAFRIEAEATLVARIEGWESREPKIIPVWDEMPPRGKSEDEWQRWEAEGCRINVDALRRRSDAVALVTLNASLAIRNALDRIAEHRASRLKSGTGRS